MSIHHNSIEISGFEITVYPSQAQYKGKLSILTHPENVEQIKDLLEQIKEKYDQSRFENKI